MPDVLQQYISALGFVFTTGYWGDFESRVG
jgi:hypothetical protein